MVRIPDSFGIRNFLKNNQHFFKKYIFDWSESGIRILLPPI